MKPPPQNTVEDLFEGRPLALELFRRVRRFVETLGPVTVTPTKTQVAFGAHYKFAWVWLPQLWSRKRPDDSITVAFDADRRLAHPRIAQAVETRPGHWTHHVV